MEFLYFLFFIILIVFAIFYVVQFYNVLFRGFAPYLNTNGKTIYKLISEIEIKGNETVYELGCGHAGFLQLLGRKFPNTKLIGFEYSLVPFLVAKLQMFIHGVKNLQIIKKNIFKINLSEPNIIYCYLNIKTMEKLKIKFENECQPGTQIISNKFQIPNWTPEKTLEVNSNKIYFYKIK